MGAMRYVEHVADLVGNTPLVRLGAVAEGIAAPMVHEANRSLKQIGDYIREATW